MTMRVALICTGTTLGIAIAPFMGAPLDGPEGWFILTNLRIPRTLMGVLVGGTLSLVGACYQTIFANPLATPSTVGTTAGATLGALVALTLGGTAMVGGLPIVVVSAFLGAIIVTGIVTAIAAQGRARVQDVLLAGIAISLAASALASGLRYAADISATFAAVQWSLGHLAQVRYHKVLLLIPFVVPACITLLAQTRALEALVAGEERAHSQGVDVQRVRAITLGAGALAVAACVATTGPIAFVGLIVPHIVRLGVGASRRVLLPLSIVVGALFLVTCDTAARLLLPGRELPVGVVTAALGAPLLVWLVAHGRRTT